jgi:endonuclease/exonuclease/phosphatase family metal-dependent hydrolase
VTSIITWNIQYGLGCDGAIDLRRVAKVVKAMGESDVLCFQEVSRNDPAIAGCADQAAQLEALFPGYQAYFGAGVDRPPRRFGNLLLSRLPVLEILRHLLPRPAQAGIKHMQRQAIEAVVETGAGPLRVVTTHLEYYSAEHRAAQIERLRALQTEAADNEARPPKPAEGPYDAAPRPASLVLCGDLNFLPHEPEYRQLFAPPLLDAWAFFRKGEAHPPSTGLFDRIQWPKGGHCRDYFAVTADVAQRIEALEIDLTTDASDHQPLRFSLRD